MPLIPKRYFLSVDIFKDQYQIDLQLKELIAKGHWCKIIPYLNHISMFLLNYINN